MKPEHFIYKSDGLYYMQNVPGRPVLSCGVEATESNCPLEYCRCYKKTIAYNEALERAKEEAAKVDDDSSRLEIGFRISKAYDLGRNQSELGKIYTINMEEKIEVFEDVDIRCSVAGVPARIAIPVKFARIAAPKKESEEQVLSEERFKLPTPEELCEFAIVFQTNGGESTINRETLVEMVGFASLLLDRLYDSGDISKPSKKEKKISR